MNSNAIVYIIEIGRDIKANLHAIRFPNGLAFNIIVLYDSLPCHVGIQLPSLPCKILILKVDDNETTVIDKQDLCCNSGSQKIKPKRNLLELYDLFLGKAADAKFMSVIYYSVRFMGSGEIILFSCLINTG